MRLSIVTGRANPLLAEAIASALDVELTSCTVEDFPDGELQVEVNDMLRGNDVYLVQPTSPPVSNHLLELLLLADACRRRGADRLTAVVPYFGYARQDRRVRGTEAVGARLVADLLYTRFDRILTVDLHNPAIEGFFSAHLEHLSAVPLLADALRGSLSRNSIIVAPDLGAVKLSQRYADLLNLPVAYIRKVRLSGRKVSIRHVVGEVSNRPPVVIDDMISTGGTMVSAIEALLDHGCLPEITIAATHALLVSDAAERLSRLKPRRMIVTDTVFRPPETPLPIETAGVGQMIADSIKRMHETCA
ncbi:MAG: ribose-phosphate pyrophosphokinase [Desulfobacteraceae bacterium]|nr:MAG: ribose-phosphate pyrophosphokinase [Desulfobacteraceae bacterium]